MGTEGIAPPSIGGFKILEPIILTVELCPPIQKRKIKFKNISQNYPIFFSSSISSLEIEAPLNFVA